MAKTMMLCLAFAPWSSIWNHHVAEVAGEHTAPKGPTAAAAKACATEVNRAHPRVRSLEA